MGILIIGMVLRFKFVDIRILFFGFNIYRISYLTFLFFDLKIEDGKIFPTIISFAVLQEFHRCHGYQLGVVILHLSCG